jgi:hypothetical protein
MKISNNTLGMGRMNIRNLAKSIAFVLGIWSFEGVSGDNHGNFQNKMPKNLVILTKPEVEYIRKNPFKIARVDVEHLETGGRNVHQYPPCSIYGTDNQDHQVKSIRLTYADQFFLNQSLTKNGNQGWNFGHCSVRFPHGNLCFHHEFKYQAARKNPKNPEVIFENEAEDFKEDNAVFNTPDAVTFYPYGGYFKQNLPIADWQQSYFFVVRPDNKYLPESVSLLLDLIPIQSENHTVTIEGNSTNTCPPNLGYHTHKKVRLKSSGKISVGGDPVVLLKHYPEVCLPSDGVVYDHLFDRIRENINFGFRPQPSISIFALGGFYRPGCDLNEISQTFISFYLRKNNIYSEVSRLKDWWQLGLYPPLGLFEAEKIVNTTRNHPYCSLLHALTGGAAGIHLCNGEDGTGRDIFEPYYSNAAALHGIDQVLVTFFRKDNYVYRRQGDPETKIQVLNHQELSFRNISPFETREQKLKVLDRYHRATFDPPFSRFRDFSISQQLQQGGSVVNLICHKDGIIYEQAYQSYQYSLPVINIDDDLQKFYVYYRPLENTFREYQSTIPRGPDPLDSPFPEVIADSRGRSFHRDLTHDASGSNVRTDISPPRLRDTYVEEGRDILENGVRDLYEGRQDLVNGTVDARTIGCFLGASALDGAALVVQEIDERTFGAVSMVGQSLDSLAEGAGTGLRRGTRYLTGDQRVAQNVGDYASLALTTINPFSRALIPAQITQKASSLSKVHKLHKLEKNVTPKSSALRERQISEKTEKIHRNLPEPDYSTPEAAYSLRIDPTTQTGPMHIDSKQFTKADSYTKLGAPKNREEFWQKWVEKYPDTLSSENLKKVQGGYSPFVDSNWAAHFPEHHRFLGERLEHHHIDHGFLTTPLPKTLHRGKGNYSVWHTTGSSK